MLIDVDHGLGVTLLSTTPSIGVRDLAWTVMTLWRKASLGEALDAVELSQPDPTRVENAADFVGTYRRECRTLTFALEGGKLVLDPQKGTSVVLEKRGEDAFFAPHPDLERFLLQFERAETGEDQRGEVVSVCHGADWYVGEQYAGTQAFEHPVLWAAYPGHYRSHIPWQTNFRVVLRKRALWLVWPSGSEEPLTPAGEGAFRVGNETSPERLRFSQVVQGRTLCANFSGSDYYRFFVV
jgi:hypothetical protein